MSLSRAGVCTSWGETMPVVAAERADAVDEVERKPGRAGEQRQERMSISLPRELVVWVRSRARSTNKNQSAVLAEGIRSLQRAERRQKALEALRLDGDRDAEIAAEFRSVAPELPPY